jgi:hypothetical protein
MIRGSCLCGEVCFEVDASKGELRLCHCSLCRKASGSGSAALLNVPYDCFRWLGGQELISTYERPSGYGVVFCRACGSPLPDSDRRRTMFDIPAGLLDENPELAIAKHIYVGSKASWDVIAGGAARYEEMPPHGGQAPR